MLEKLNLDDSSYNGIYEKAARHLAGQASWWTHTEVSDPGVTLLEMWALLCDMQSFYLDQVQESHYRKYLKLLGIWPDEGQPASALVFFDRVRKDTALPEGTKLLADQMVFETAEESRLTANHITALYLGRKEGTEEENRISLMNRPRKTPFPLQPGKELFSLALQKAVEPGGIIDFYVLLDETKGRTPAGEDFFMAALSWEYLTENGYRRARVYRDETRGLLYSGFVSLQMESQMIPDGEGVGYPIRCRIREGSFDVMPVLYGIYLNGARTFQKNTLCREEKAAFYEASPYVALKSYLALTGDIQVYARRGEDEWEDFTEYCEVTPPVTAENKKRRIIFDRERFGRVPEEGAERVKIVCSVRGLGEEYQPCAVTGISSQRIPLPWKNLMRGSVGLMLCQGEGTRKYRPYLMTEPEEDRYPYAWHWLEGEDTIELGDGRHGEIPKPAEDGLRLTGLVLWEGEEGNVSIGRISRLERPDLYPGIRCRNPMAGKGGRNRQEPSAQFSAVKERLFRENRMVTGEDIRKLALETPGLILEDVKAEREDGKVRVVIVPACQLDEYCGRKYAEETARYLEQYRPVGSRIEVVTGKSEESGRERQV